MVNNTFLRTIFTALHDCLKLFKEQNYLLRKRHANYSFYRAVADPGFPGQGGKASTPEFWAKTYYLARFCQKLHEIERNWIWGRGEITNSYSWKYAVGKVSLQVASIYLNFVLNSTMVYDVHGLKY